MIDERTTTAQVEVEVDSQTAFRVFTEEIDRWWVAGPINFYDSARAVAMRCESGVGGRLLEVYDEATGEGLELGRITVWEPGELLGWHSSVDDVEITVRFVAVDGGTKWWSRHACPRVVRTRAGPHGCEWRHIGSALGWRAEIAKARLARRSVGSH